MIALTILRPILLLTVTIFLAWPLGLYMARVYKGERTWLHPVLRPLERLIYRLSGIDEAAEQGWQSYTKALLLFSVIGVFLLYALQRLQALLPWNPAGLAPVSPYLAFNTAVSFVTNTNWQNYAGEQTMSYFTQMAGLAVQNFLSAAAGIAVAIALVRSFTRRQSKTIGNFWVDLTRTVVYVLLPLSVVMSLVLVSQGAVQTLQGPATASIVDRGAQQAPIQTIARGPVASQEAIKELGTNGGGFFNANSAHSFENPNPLTNWIEMVALLLIPFALPIAFGAFVGDRRQGVAVLIAMVVIASLSMGGNVWSEVHGNPVLTAAGADQRASVAQAGGNMEGKEVRFGPTESAMFATATTLTSTGSVIAMHDSLTPLGGLVTLWGMHLGEVAPGGVGSGLYGMLVMAIIAVFIAGLMVGRTPEYLGKKIEPYEMKMAALYFLIMPLLVLTGTALAVLLPAGRASILNGGPHGLSEVLYAFSSTVNNNGSAFAGLNGNTPFYNIMLGVAMLAGRFWMMVPVLAIAGSLAAKKIVPAGTGTLPTHNGLFIGWLVAVVIIAGALNFLPVLSLGPVVEHFLMLQGRVF